MAKPILDFQILDTNDPRALLVADSSKWEFIENKKSIIEIIIPGRIAPVVTYFDKGRVNIFNSLTLSINCISGCKPLEHVDLPDGIYNIKIKGSPDTFSKERNYYRDTNLRLRWDLLYISLDILNNDNVVEALKDVEVLLNSARANTKYNNINNAQAHYNKALELIEQLENCEECKDDEHAKYKTQNRRKSNRYYGSHLY